MIIVRVISKKCVMNEEKQIFGQFKLFPFFLFNFKFLSDFLNVQFLSETSFLIFYKFTKRQHHNNLFYNYLLDLLYLVNGSIYYQQQSELNTLFSVKLTYRNCKQTHQCKLTLKYTLIRTVNVKQNSLDKIIIFIINITQ